MGSCRHPHRRVACRQDKIGARYLPSEHGGGEVARVPGSQFGRRWFDSSAAHFFQLRAGGQARRCTTPSRSTLVDHFDESEQAAASDDWVVLLFIPDYVDASLPQRRRWDPTTIHNGGCHQTSVNAFNGTFRCHFLRPKSTQSSTKKKRPITIAAVDRAELSVSEITSDATLSPMCSAEPETYCGVGIVVPSGTIGEICVQLSRSTWTPN